MNVFFSIYDVNSMRFFFIRTFIQKYISHLDIQISLVKLFADGIQFYLYTTIY